MALAYAGLKYEHREVALQRKPEELLQASPKGTVPVLVLADGGVLDESLDIMAWALMANDPAGWRVEDRALLQRMDQWVAATEAKFKPHLDAYKYSSHLAPENWLPHRQAAQEFLAALAAELGTSAYFWRSTMGYTDVAILPFVRQFANVDLAWFRTLEHPALIAWMERMLQHPLFTQVMHKYPEWSTDAGKFPVVCDWTQPKGVAQIDN